MTASYGSGEMTIAPSTVGRVAVSNVRPVPALIPRIRFDLSWTLHHALSLEEGHPGKEFVLTDFPGQLTVGPDNPVRWQAREGRIGLPHSVAVPCGNAEKLRRSRSGRTPARTP